MQLHGQVGQQRPFLAQRGAGVAATPRLCTGQQPRTNRVGAVGVLARAEQVQFDSPPVPEEPQQAPEPPSSGGWWTKNNPSNMRDVNSIQQLVDELADAGDKLVIVEFYAPWCNACKALFPKLCRIMAEHEDDVLFLKVSFESNKDMCKTMGVKVLPLFHFYRGAEGRVDQFSCTISKLQRFKDALENYSSAFCSLEDFPGVEEFPDVHAHAHDTPTQLHNHPHAWE